MDWTRSETLALALHNCAACHGAGLKFGKKNELIPCGCVLRSIFRICHERFLRVLTQERYLSRVSLEPSRGRQRPGTWGRKDEEFLADFVLVSKRVLSRDEWKLFRLHFMWQQEWKVCSRMLGINRGNFFHAVYRIEQKLGRVFRELEPYPLFPLDEYFNGPSRLAAPKPYAKMAAPTPIPLRPPLEEKPTAGDPGLLPATFEPGSIEPSEDEEPAYAPATRNEGDGFAYALVARGAA